MNHFFESSNDGFLMLSIGKRRSGKSTLLVHLIKNNLISRFGKRNIFLIYPSIFDNDNQYIFLNLFSDNLSNTYSPKLIEGIFNKQSELIKKNTDTKPILIILDDCISSEAFKQNKHSNILNKIAAVGRHKKISLIIATQSIKGISTGLRSNSDFIIVYKSYGAELEKIIADIRPIKKKEFELILHGLEQYEFIFIDLIKNSIWKYIDSQKVFKKILYF